MQDGLGKSISTDSTFTEDTALRVNHLSFENTSSMGFKSGL